MKKELKGTGPGAPYEMNRGEGLQPEKQVTANQARKGQNSKNIDQSSNNANLKRIIFETGKILAIVMGGLITALGFALFQVPHQIAAGGIAGVGIIVNHFTGFPVGTFYLLLNLPLMVLGFFYLGRWLFILRTLIAVLVFSVATDAFIAVLPETLSTYPVSNDVLLCSIYAGILAGVGGGLLYHAGSTTGGTAIVGRILQLKTGIPLSQVYLYTDGIIIGAAGLLFGWEVALYAMLTLVLSGMVADYTLEGPSSIRVATIITNQPKDVSQALMTRLNRGVSSWEIVGEYSGQKRTMLMCTIFRPQVPALKQVIAEVEPSAFVTIASGYQAMGEGFMKLRPRRV